MTYYLPSSLDFRARRVAFSTWYDHVPFGYDIVAELRPEIIVELGTHRGMSFFTFCQALEEQNIDGFAYAVDTWQGDDHTGEYGEDIYHDVEKHARDFYRGISYLMRMQFDEAVSHFQDESIDLLHIDGLHTYDAVKNDFENWYPKVKPGGVILFHDIEAKVKDFGVWKYWATLEKEYPTFNFKHGFGLGVLEKPGGMKERPLLLKLLLEGSDSDHHKLRKLYAHISRYLEVESELKMIERKRKEQQQNKSMKSTG